MSVIQSNYKPPLFYNRHLATVWMGRLRAQKTPSYIRERVSYEQDDFLDLDWLYSESDKLVIITHGLEGSSGSHSVSMLAESFHKNGWNVLAWNMRGCSSEQNRKLQSYCSGSSDQLEFVIEHACRIQKLKDIHLVGISVGGNITLKYLGEKSANFNSRIKSAAAICPPCDLAGSSEALAKPQNFLYLQDILRSLKNKVRLKKSLLPAKFNFDSILKTKNFAEFDRLFTAPINGFIDEKDYYQHSSSLPLLHNIRLRTLLLTAVDDPFLSPSCIPYQIAERHSFLYLEAAQKGGHVAFPWKNWLAERICSWITSAEQICL